MSSIISGFEGLSGPAELMLNQLVYDAAVLRHLEDRDLSRLSSVALWLNQQAAGEVEIPAILSPEDTKTPKVLDFIDGLVVDYEDKSITVENGGGMLLPEEYILGLYMHDNAMPKEVIDEVASHISETGFFDEIAHAELVNALTGGIDA